MAEEVQMVDSTAQLEVPQETAEVEANVVEEAPSEEGGDGNMSLSELTTQLLAKAEGQKEGEAETTEQAVVEEEPDQQKENPEVERPTSETESGKEGEVDKELLLDKYGINLDELGEDEAMSLGRARRTESLKRFGRLTAQKREAEAKIEELENNTVSEARTPAQSNLRDDPMSEVWTEETLSKKETDLQSIEDWAEEALTLEAQYDDDGEEYVVEAEGKKYTKQDLLGIRSNARKMLRRGGSVDKRRNFLTQRQQSDSDALQWFPWMSDENSSEFGEYKQFVSNDKYKELLDTIPEANVFAGLLVEGNLRVRERQKPATNGSTPQPQRERPTAPVMAASAAPKRATAVDSSRMNKALNQAKQSFEKTGSMQSLARLRELQGQMS